MSEDTSTAISTSVIPAYLGWGNAEDDRVGLRLYATDHEPATSPRWDPTFPGGRVVEYAATERQGGEGDRYLVVRVGDRFISDEEVERVAIAITEALGRGSETP